MPSGEGDKKYIPKQFDEIKVKMIKLYREEVTKLFHQFSKHTFIGNTFKDTSVISTHFAYDLTQMEEVMFSCFVTFL